MKELVNFIRRTIKGIVKKGFIYRLYKFHLYFEQARKTITRKTIIGKIGAYAEIGVAQGSSVLNACSLLKPNSSIYIFDYNDVVENVLRKIESKFPQKFKIYKFGNSGKQRDSYCWSLVNLIGQNRNNKIFDYVYVDGSHDLTIDGLTFYLADILLKKGGYIEFDDYEWTILKSPTVNPAACPLTLERYTDEQITVPQVKLIIDNLVKTHINYKEIVKNRVYRKVR